MRNLINVKSDNKLSKKRLRIIGNKYIFQSISFIFPLNATASMQLLPELFAKFDTTKCKNYEENVSERGCEVCVCERETEREREAWRESNYPQ